MSDIGAVQCFGLFGFLVVKGLVISTLSQQVLVFLPVIIIPDEVNHLSVDCILNNGMKTMYKYAFAVEKGVACRTQHTAIWDASVQDMI